MRKKLVTTSLLLATFLFGWASSASAIGLSFSDKTQKPTIVLDLKGNYNLPFNLALNAGVSVAPLYSDLVGKSSSMSGTELWSVLASAEANLGYNWTLVDIKTAVGDFNPTITPFAGYKHYWTHSGSKASLDLSAPVTTTSNIGGMNYGLRFSSSLPLGLFGYIEGGMTALFDGNISLAGAESQSMNAKNTKLPFLRMGAKLNVLNIASLYAGYGLEFYPDLRDTELSQSSMVHALNAGFSILFFSI